MFNPRTSRRQLIVNGGKVALGATALGAFLEACGKAAVSHGPVPAGDIAFWYYVDDQNIRDYVTKAEVQAFNAAYPKIHLSYVFKTLETPSSVLDSALATGHGPDLVPTSGASYAVPYAQKGYLLALDAYAKQYAWKNKMLGWALQSGQVQGKLYSLPLSYETMVIYYNKTLFQAKGWTVPQSRSDLEALCTDAHAQGISPFMGGKADWKGTTEWFVTVFLNHFAGPDAVYQALTGKARFSDATFVDAITLLKSYFDKGWFGGSVDHYFATGFNPEDTRFATGKAAMDMEGSWALQTWPTFFGDAAKNPSNDWDWFPVPPLNTGVAPNIFSLATGGTISINAHTTAPDAAAQYMDWLYSTPKRVTAELVDLSLEPLPLILGDSDFPSTVDERVKRMYIAIDNSTKQGNFGYTTWTFWGPKSDAWCYDGMDKVLTGNITPAQFCQQLDTLFTAELLAGTVPFTIPRVS